MFKCKITKKKIPEIINFGKMPIANGFLKKKDFNREFFIIWEYHFQRYFSPAIKQPS